MRRLTIGVDPGLEGGIAILEDGSDEPIALVPMPVIKPKKGRAEYDVPAIVLLLRRSIATGPCRMVLEKLHPLPPKIAPGVIANYNRGAARWLFVGLAAALGLPLQEVTAQTWQREMLKGASGSDTKQRSIIAAQRRFPEVSLLPSVRARKPADGLSDALLLAEYGRRQEARVWDGAPEPAR